MTFRDQSCRWCGHHIYKPSGQWIHRTSGKAKCWDGEHTAEPAPGAFD